MANQNRICNLNKHKGDVSKCDVSSTLWTLLIFFFSGLVKISIFKNLAEKVKNMRSYLHLVSASQMRRFQQVLDTFDFCFSGLVKISIFENLATV